MSLAQNTKIIKSASVSKNRRADLTSDVIIQIRNDFSQNIFTYHSLAKKYNIGMSAIARIVNYQTYKNIK